MEGRESVSSIASRYKASPQQVTNWKKELKTGVDLVFTKAGKSKQNLEEKERPIMLL